MLDAPDGLLILGVIAVAIVLASKLGSGGGSNDEAVAASSPASAEPSGDWWFTTGSETCRPTATTGGVFVGVGIYLTLVYVFGVL